MTFKRSDIQKLANLARVGLTVKQEKTFAEDMNRIVAWVSILQAAPVANLEPLTHAHDGTTPLREDRITEQPGGADLFANAAQTENGFFLTPQVLQ